MDKINETDKWVNKYHNGYLVVGWGAIINEYLIIRASDGNERIILQYGIEPNGNLPDNISIPIEPMVMPKYTDTWQLCPKCNGQGTISKSTYIQGDLSQYASTSPVRTCDVCNGMKIIKR